MTNRIPTQRDDYLFDLNGFLRLGKCLSDEQLEKMNGWIDRRPKVQPGEWIGKVHRQNHAPKLGENYQQIYETEAFRPMIDHPAWIELVKRYVGGTDNYDAIHGPLFIDENFLNIRGPGQAISLHNGGHLSLKRCQYEYRNNEWMCGQINILVALQDVGPGDGATMVIPASHKSRIKHHQYDHIDYGNDSVDTIEGAVEVYLKAGEAILFVDSISHGSAERKNLGERRIAVFRYGPSWGGPRYGYEPSEELLSQLSAEAKLMVKPHRPIAI
jgi:hypothetical protein